MKALQYTAYGDRPTVAEVPRPVAGPDEVVVRVAAAALNPLDVKIARGQVHEWFPVTFPAVVGTDLAGTIEEIGAGVSGWRVGDAVIARTEPTEGGAVAEYARVPARLLARAPESVPLEAACGLATAAATAWQAVNEMAEVKPGQTVLVHAGAGGVGSFAIQVARLAGARVVTTVSTAGVAIAEGLGADVVVDYTRTDFRSVISEDSAISDVDVVVDPIGGEIEQASLDVLRPGGLLLGLNAPPDAERTAVRGVRAEFVFHTSYADRLAKVAEVAADGGLTVLLDRAVGFDAAAEAFDHIARGHAKGKVVIRP